MPRGFVALLDVLGFSSLVASDGEGKHLERYLACLQEALDFESGGPTVDYVAFSDSIVLTTQEDSEPALQAILLRCSRAFGMMLRHEIALRGAIAYGSFFRSDSPSGVFVAGRAILDAYRFETLQDWVGIMLAPSTIKRVSDLANRFKLPSGDMVSEEIRRAIRKHIPWTAFIQPCPSIPFHGGHPLENNNFSGFAVVPTDGVAEPAALRDSVEQSLQALAWLRSVAPSPSSQMKYSRSEAWLMKIRDQWCDVVSAEDRLRKRMEANK